MSTTTEIRNNVEKAIVEMGYTHKERLAVIKGMWVALVARQHLLMLGPGGTGKSLLARDVADRIDNAYYFESAGDETSDPGQFFGPVDIKAMKEEGKHRRRITGMLPEADIAFIDEFFNLNGPTLHGMMPILNERYFHNNGQPMETPLWSAFMGTNKLNADTDQAATWDRVHLRYVVKYVQDREAVRDLITDSVNRRVTSYTEPPKATIDLDDLKAAHDEAMTLNVPDNAWETFLDIRDELLNEGVEVSTRRQAEGMVAVLANTWVDGNTEVNTGNLDILQHMWWSYQADMEKVQKIILAATNPGEKAALEYLDEIEQYNQDLREIERQDLDDTKKGLKTMEIIKNTKHVLSEADDLDEKAKAAGASTARIEELRKRATDLKNHIQKEYYGL